VEMMEKMTVVMMTTARTTAAMKVMIATMEAMVQTPSALPLDHYPLLQLATCEFRPRHRFHLQHSASLHQLTAASQLHLLCLCQALLTLDL